jgi:cobalt-zinc-cadmium efflux system protein
VVAVSDAHADQHEHGHHGHSHAISASSDARWLTVALVINLVFMVCEVVAGLIADSLALLSDAGHMLTDAGAIALALVAVRLAQRPARGAFTFGLGRAEILSAQINGVSLLVLAGLIAVPALQRISDPPEIEGGVVLVVGLAGAAVNAVAAWALSRASRESLNVRGAFLHSLADMASSLAAALAGLAVLAFGFDAADGIASLSVAALMLWGGWGLVRDSGRVLLEAAPRGADPERIGRAMAAAPGIVEVHDLHVWEVTSGFTALAAHVVVAPDDDCHARRRELTRMLADAYGIRHATLQVDHARSERSPLLAIEARRRPEA